MRAKFFLIISLLFFSHFVQAESPIPITVFRSPTCGCCGQWIEHLKKNNFIVTDRLTENMQAIKAKYGVSNDIASCHTALTGGYVIEGHVPANDIKALLRNRPSVFGISVPNMPSDAPGMEQHAQQSTNFNKNNQIGMSPKTSCSIKQ